MNPAAVILAMVVAVVRTTILSVASNEPNSVHPELTLTFTNDITFTCSLADFPGRVSGLAAIQILQNTSDHGQVILATADFTGVRKSSFLQRVHPVSMVTGGVQKSQAYDSKLTLTLSDARPQVFGSYMCHILYREHSADVTVMTWQSDVIDFNNDTTASHERAGFRLTWSKGVDTNCYVPSKNNMSDVKSIGLFSREKNVLLAKWTPVKEENAHNENISVESLFLPETFTVSLRVHFWNRCMDDKTYLCRADIEGQGLTESGVQNLHMGDCEKQKENQQAETVQLTSNDDEGIDADADERFGILGKKPMIAAIAPGLIIFFTCIGALFVTMRWKNRRDFIFFRRCSSSEDGIVNLSLTPDFIHSSIVDLRQSRHSADDAILTGTTSGHASVRQCQNEACSKEERECLRRELSFDMTEPCSVPITEISSPRRMTASVSCMDIPVDIQQALHINDSTSLSVSVAEDMLETNEAEESMSGQDVESDRLSVSGRLSCPVEDQDLGLSYCV